MGETSGAMQNQIVDEAVISADDIWNLTLTRDSCHSVYEKKLSIVPPEEISLYDIRHF